MTSQNQLTFSRGIVYKMEILQQTSKEQSASVVAIIARCLYIGVTVLQVLNKVVWWLCHSRCWSFLMTFKSPFFRSNLHVCTRLSCTGKTRRTSTNVSSNGWGSLGERSLVQRSWYLPWARWQRIRSPADVQADGRFKIFESGAKVRRKKASKNSAMVF